MCCEPMDVSTQPRSEAVAESGYGKASSYFSTGGGSFSGPAARADLLLCDSWGSLVRQKDLSYFACVPFVENYVLSASLASAA
ncbi:hypothethical protein (plasmid) [Ralstonia solanacearum PSI07]|nr:hypothethical protein [Ralstonia solanacearum PSI07]